TEQQRQTVGEPDFDELRKALVQWAEYEFEHYEALQQQNVALARLERSTGTPLAQSTAAARAGSTLKSERGTSDPGRARAPEGPEPAANAVQPATEPLESATEPLDPAPPFDISP